MSVEDDNRSDHPFGSPSTPTAPAIPPGVESQHSHPRAYDKLRRVENWRQLVRAGEPTQIDQYLSAPAFQPLDEQLAHLTADEVDVIIGMCALSQKRKQGNQDINRPLPTTEGFNFARDLLTDQHHDVVVWDGSLNHPVNALSDCSSLDADQREVGFKNGLRMFKMIEGSGKKVRLVIILSRLVARTFGVPVKRHSGPNCLPIGTISNPLFPCDQAFVVYHLAFLSSYTPAMKRVLVGLLFSSALVEILGSHTLSQVYTCLATHCTAHLGGPALKTLDKFSTAIQGYNNVPQHVQNESFVDVAALVKRFAIVFRLARKRRKGATSTKTEANAVNNKRKSKTTDAKKSHIDTPRALVKRLIGAFSSLGIKIPASFHSKRHRIQLPQLRGITNNEYLTFVPAASDKQSGYKYGRFWLDPSSLTARVEFVDHGGAATGRRLVPDPSQAGFLQKWIDRWGADEGVLAELRRQSELVPHSVLAQVSRIQATFAQTAELKANSVVGKMAWASERGLQTINWNRSKADFGNRQDYRGRTEHPLGQSWPWSLEAQVRIDLDTYKIFLSTDGDRTYTISSGVALSDVFNSTSQQDKFESWVSDIKDHRFYSAKDQVEPKSKPTRSANTKRTGDKRKRKEVVTDEEESTDDELVLVRTGARQVRVAQASGSMASSSLASGGRRVV